MARHAELAVVRALRRRQALILRLRGEVRELKLQPEDVDNAALRRRELQPQPQPQLVLVVQRCHRSDQQPVVEVS